MMLYANDMSQVHFTLIIKTRFLSWMPLNMLNCIQLPVNSYTSNILYFYFSLEIASLVSLFLRMCVHVCVCVFICPCVHSYVCVLVFVFVIFILFLSISINFYLTSFIVFCLPLTFFAISDWDTFRTIVTTSTTSAIVLCNITHFILNDKVSISEVYLKYKTKKSSLLNS